MTLDELESQEQGLVLQVDRAMTALQQTRGALAFVRKMIADEKAKGKPKAKPEAKAMPNNEQTQE